MISFHSLHSSKVAVVATNTRLAKQIAGNVIARNFGTSINQQKEQKDHNSQPKNTHTNGESESPAVSDNSSKANKHIKKNQNAKNLSKLQQSNLNEHLRSLMPEYHKVGSEKAFVSKISYLRGANNAPESITMESLVAAGTHFGHSKSTWNALNLPWIFGERHGIHIINLEHTISALRRAAQVVESIAYHGGLIIFVGTRANTRTSIIEAAMGCGQFHVTKRWIPGTITNASSMLSHEFKYVEHQWDVPEAQDLVRSPEETLVAKIQKLRASKQDNQGYKQRQLRRLDFEKILLEQQRKAEIEADQLTTYKPDLIISFNPREMKTMLAEAKLAHVPTIGLVDTNADPRDVSYVIPGNDDSVRSVALVANILAKAALRGKTLREDKLKRAAEDYRRQCEILMRKEQLSL
ncbi:hypothetical protein H4219_002553 [Mycoemilia scoparia]|uniref:Ribosomal protein S2 n=1 Tax=Mycoemilia scoparia TaxID=417184 RepID=A0A9W8DTX3_9FUNG|nr:hypothetical protein H4219_002553 [Mycoemilia scoparia]